MGHEVTIGGERLGSGKKMKAYLHNYERSTHDLSYVWRSTMASGTLVPFMSQVALPGDTFDIDLNVDILTHPTIGPLFGSYKIQLDVFQIPIRLYQGQLHMNMLGIGLDMSKILLPKLNFSAAVIDKTKTIDNQQINPSSILSYLGIRGLGYDGSVPTATPVRKFNAIPYLGYWDIYKNYYANKQEEIGAVIHKNPQPNTGTLTDASIEDAEPNITFPVEVAAPPYTYVYTTMNATSRIVITAAGLTADATASDIKLFLERNYAGQTFEQQLRGDQMFQTWEIYPDTGTMIGTNPVLNLANEVIGWGNADYAGTTVEEPDQEPQITTFPLTNIDDMRKLLLAKLDGTEFLIDNTAIAPYGLPMQNFVAGPNIYYSQLANQEGLALKTYNSDLFNNWIQTEWIDGVDGISAVTAIDTTGGSFTIDELNLSRKIYDMLNRIAISGGSYDDWLDAVYTHERQRSAENPIYLGGLIDKLVFQEVISQTNTPTQPLGTLAGRGKVKGATKGGKIIAKIDEPSYLMGIISLTPNIDYSQGNQWDVNLKTMNDLHKPALDEIGFQDLITDQMAWWDTNVNGPGSVPEFKSAGKQPAWVNYMTNVNTVKGNFAEQSEQMFMVLNRRYNVDYAGNPKIADLTTYIDPTKFNHIFADTRRDSQNFWAQIGVNIEARRKMSAKVMPNL
ncbi:MAG: major capsid protein [Microviridae sp.]|nr:MAG: major capsid protein [Microviridae sp.]